MRQCGTCTKCCEGWLMGDINLRTMYPGKPCYLLDIGKGCSDYENRPAFPCRVFNCAWIVDQGIPEEYKPENSGVIPKYTNRNGQKSLFLIPAPNHPSEDMLDWFKQFCSRMGYELFWNDSTDTPFFYNTKDKK